jgi:hypothetical protein
VTVPALVARAEDSRPIRSLEAGVAECGATAAQVAGPRCASAVDAPVSGPSHSRAAILTTVLRSGLLVGVGILISNRFAEHTTTRPWLLAVTGLAVATLLIVARMAVARLVVAAGAPAAHLPPPAGADPGAPLPRDRP